jgi:exonuclease III
MRDQTINVIGTWNVWNENSADRVADGVKKMSSKHGCDVIVLQEVSGFIGRLRKVALNLGFFLHVMKMGKMRGIDLAEARSTVILRGLWIPLIASGFIRIVTKWIGPKARIIRPGRTFPRIKAGKPGIQIVGFHGNTGRFRFKRNRRSWQETLNKLDKRVVKWKKRGVRFVIIGDTNDRRSNRDLESLWAFARKHGLDLVHDEATIDYSLCWGFASTHYESFTKMGSDDHRYGILTVTY